MSLVWIIFEMVWPTIEPGHLVQKAVKGGGHKHCTLHKDCLFNFKTTAIASYLFRYNIYIYIYNIYM